MAVPGGARGRWQARPGRGVRGSHSETLDVRILNDPYRPDQAGAPKAQSKGRHLVCSPRYAILGKGLRPDCLTLDWVDEVWGTLAWVHEGTQSVYGASQT